MNDYVKYFEEIFIKPYKTYYLNVSFSELLKNYFPYENKVKRDAINILGSILSFEEYKHNRYLNNYQKNNTICPENNMYLLLGCPLPSDHLLLMLFSVKACLPIVDYTHHPSVRKQC